MSKEEFKIDQKIEGYYKRAKKILGVEIKSNFQNAADLTAFTNMLSEVVKLIQIEENMSKSKGEKK